jgi:chromosome segregation ATPase
MTTTNNTEIQELKQFISDRFNQLDRKLDETKSELKQDLSNTKSELKQDISDLKGNLKALHVEISANKIPEITEKFGELKNWRQTAFVIIAGVVSAFLGWLARGGKV